MTPLSNGLGDYVRLMLVLGGILLLAFVAIRFWIPKLMPWNRPASGPMQVWAKLPLEPQKTLYIIKAGKSFLLVSSSEAGVQYITSLNAEDLAEAGEHKEPEPGESKFAPLIRTGKAGG
jgi:flagellar biogenesis protein FliO